MSGLTVVWKTRDSSQCEYIQRGIRKLPQAVNTMVVTESQGIHDRLQSNGGVNAVYRVDDTALTYARNLGLKNAETKYVAFMDDDAVPTAQWSRAILEALEGADAAGGPLKLPEGTVTWLPETWHWLVGCGPYYNDRRLVPNTYGSNWAVDREAALSVGGFDDTIGMGSSSNIWQGAETDLANRLRGAGFQATAYHPDAVVHHHTDIPAPIEIFTRAYHQGRAKAHIGTGAQESRFIREELAACLNRPPWESGAAGLLVGLVAAGYLRGKLTV